MDQISKLRHGNGSIEHPLNKVSKQIMLFYRPSDVRDVEMTLNGPVNDLSLNYKY